MTLGKFLRAVALAALLAAVFGGASNADPLKIRLGWVSPTDFGPILFPKPGIAKHLGQSYELETVHFTGTPGVVTAIATGDLDVGVFSFSSLGLAVENAKLDDIRVILDVEQDGVPGYGTTEFMVRKDSGIEKIEDLKGKVLASPGAGSANDMAVRIMMTKHGLTEPKDYTMIEANFPNMKALLADRKVDLISGGSAALSHDPALREMARTLFTERDAMGVTQLVMWAARAGFIAKNRPALVDFLEDVLRSRHFYFDPANHDEAVGYVAKFLDQPPGPMSPWLFNHQDLYRDPHGLPNIAAVQSNIDVMHQLGYLKASLDVHPYFDLSVVQDAGKRLQ